MATCTLKETSAKTGSKGSGSATYKYELIADSVILDPLDALAIARGLGVPAYGTALTSASREALYQQLAIERQSKTLDRVKAMQAKAQAAK